MSIAERADAPLEVAETWEDLLTPDEPSAEERPQTQDFRPDPEATTQEHQPETGQVDPATPVAETTDQRLARLEAEYQRTAAENAELQRKIADREWSSQGRFLAEQKKTEQLTERLNAIEAERANADQYLTNIAEHRRQQYLAAGDQVGAQNVQLALENELLKRQANRDREDREVAQRHAQELQQAQQQHETISRGRQVQQAFIPTMQAEAMAAAQHFGLDEAEAQDLVAFATPKSLRNLAANAPPEVLGQLAMEQYEVIIERAQAMVARKVQQNQQHFDTTRERAGGGTSRDLQKEFDDLAPDDWEGYLALEHEGYQPPQQRRGRR